MIYAEKKCSQGPTPLFSETVQCSGKPTEYRTVRSVRMLFVNFIVNFLSVNDNRPVNLLKLKYNS